MGTPSRPAGSSSRINGSSSSSSSSSSISIRKEAFSNTVGIMEDLVQEEENHLNKNPAEEKLPAAVSDDEDDEHDDNDQEGHRTRRSILDDDVDSTNSSDNDSQLQDAVAASSALVGENVLDSPQGAYGRRPILKAPSTPLPSAETTTAAARSSLAYPSPPPSLSHVPPQQQQQRRVGGGGTGARVTSPGPDSNSNALSVGMMAQGLAWVQRQRDRRRRQFLQNQAEQQLRRIREAREAEKLRQLQQQQQQSSSSLTDNSTFQNFAKALRGNLEALSDDTRSTYPEDTIVSTLSCQGPAISQSGDGYSVSLPDVGDSKDDDDDDEQAQESWIPPVRVEPEPAPVMETAPFVLGEKEMQQIAEHVLPRGIAYCRWKRLYSLARDGDSFEQCLRFVENETRTLLVVRSSRNEVCGGFADMPWNHNGSASVGYFGGSESCLFKVVDGKVHDYKWSGLNRYILLCDPVHKMLAFGGGGDDGAFGLSVEQDFQVGSTGHCDTFQNDPLCDQETFAIVDMEIYGFLIGQF